MLVMIIGLVRPVVFSGVLILLLKVFISIPRDILNSEFWDLVMISVEVIVPGFQVLVIGFRSVRFLFGLLIVVLLLLCILCLGGFSGLSVGTDEGLDG